MIEVLSNGSKWAGERPDSIEDLIRVLGENPLDRRFENFGGFVERNTNTGKLSILGNFYNLSHVFHILADTLDEVQPLVDAIRRNQQRADYLSQKRPDPIVCRVSASAD